MTPRPAISTRRRGTDGDLGAVTLAAAAVEAALAAGAVAAEGFVKQSLTRSSSAPSGEWSASMERGVALRIALQGGREASASATHPPGPPDAPTLLALARGAAAAAMRAHPSAPLLLPAGEPDDGRGLGLFDPDLDPPGDSIAEAASEIHSLAAELPGGAARVDLQAMSATVALANSAGFRGAYRQTLVRLDLTVASQAGAATRVARAARSLRALGADLLVSEAAALLEERSAARHPPSGIHETILAPRAAAEILAALTPFLAATAGPGPSHASAGKRDPGAKERIASASVTITDDGRLPGGVASAPFDGEGTPTRRTILVRRGVRHERIRDLRTGAEAGGISTGNGVRGSFREIPSLRPTNLFIHPGTPAPSEVLASVRQGVRIGALGRIPPVASLDTPIVVPFTGRWISEGRTTDALAGGFLAGTLREILMEVETAGSDLTFFHRRGSFGAPTLLLRRAAVRSA